MEINYPTKLWIGSDSLQRLAELKNERIFVVTDQAMKNLPSFEKVVSMIDSTNDYEIFSEVTPDPPISVLIAGIDAMKTLKPSMILAIGGGSVIDAAKGMNYFGAQTGVTENVTFIAVPTTSGTGSEVTNFSVITDETKGQKYPLVTDEIQPDEAILATDILLSIPPHITADTGMDVLTHVIESYVSTKCNDFSDALCEKVVKLVFTYLPICFENGNNYQAREKMHNASTMAGMAFNTTSLGLNHGLAHSLGGRFHIAHGRLNAILLPKVILYNAGMLSGQEINEDIAYRYSKLASAITKESYNPRMGTKKLVRLIEQLNRKLKIPSRLTDTGLPKDEYLNSENEVAIAALKDGCTATNPVVPTTNDIKQILKEVI